MALLNLERLMQKANSKVIWAIFGVVLIFALVGALIIYCGMPRHVLVGDSLSPSGKYGLAAFQKVTSETKTTVGYLFEISVRMEGKDVYAVTDSVTLTGNRRLGRSYTMLPQPFEKFVKWDEDAGRVTVETPEGAFTLYFH